VKTFSGIRILIKDGRPFTKGLGKNLAGVVDGMMLNFTYENFNTNCKSYRYDCIEVHAVHEFGHALGIDHEQSRPDAPTCTENDQTPSGDGLIGPYDPHSVMNYCDDNDWDGLSAGDIETVNFLYPFKLGPPRNPAPTDYGRVYSSSKVLKWDAADPYFSENITYDVYLGKTLPLTTPIATGLSQTSLKATGLSMNAQYYWQVVARRTQTFVRESGSSGILWTSLFSTYSQTQTTTKTEQKGPIWNFDTRVPLSPILSMLQQ